jgi:GxxExxY protein
MFRGSSPLDRATEAQIEKVIECAIQVHRTLGPGFFELAYQNAMCVELAEWAVPFESQKRVVVRYHGVPVVAQRLDFLIAGEIVLELKAVAALEPIHHVQLMSYLRGAGLRVGLLMNFGALSLRAGLKRIIV